MCHVGPNRHMKLPREIFILGYVEKMSLIMQIIIKLKQKRLIKNEENSRVPPFIPFIPYPKVFKSSDVQDYILTIHFKLEIKISLNRLREESVVAFHRLF